VIILDTNVVSEPLRPAPDARVLAWLDRQSSETLFLTSIGLAELAAGVAVLPAGKRRMQLHETVSRRVRDLFRGRILPFDAQAADAFGAAFAGARKAGNAVDFADCAVAAIAASRKFAVATRNVRDFRGTGVALLNPWD
jgi:predicted nucleic acid-binding protein